MPDIVDFVHREINHAHERLHRIVGIRVSDHAIPGSPVTLPVAPERARLFARLLIQLDPRGGGGLAMSDPVEADSLREILVHPDDFHDARGNPPRAPNYTYDLIGPPTHIYGIPVLKDPGAPRT